MCYSFGPIKHLTCGDGGALVTFEGNQHRARLLRWHGLDRTSSADFRCAQTIHEPGHKWHMNDINAAIGLANIDHTEWVVAQHRRNAAYYDRVLAGAPGVALPPPDEQASYWCYFLLVEDREDFMAFMRARGIATSPVHARNDTHPAYRSPSGPLPGTDHYGARNVAIPVGWWVGEQERDHVAGAVLEWAYDRGREVAD
jgi:dTDP-4-amino-4,6-dideoxygalactose transaminase